MNCSGNALIIKLYKQCIYLCKSLGNHGNTHVQQHMREQGSYIDQSVGQNQLKLLSEAVLKHSRAKC